MPTVLVVDDSPLDRRLAGGLLEKHFECAVEYAADGKEALARVALQVPDVVLTDLQMPQMNGLELVTALKNDYPFVPVVLMTAKGSEDIAAEALRRGAASYVPKKRLAEDLRPTIQRILVGSFEDQGHSGLMHHLESNESVFVLANDLHLIQALVTHLQQLLRCLSLGDETERLRVGVALEEALLNAYYHGNLEMAGTFNPSDRQAIELLARERQGQAPYCNRRIHVTARISRAEAVVTIRDEGPGFDASDMSATLQPADDDKYAGRGIVLMRAIMDEVRFNPSGNEVTLVKRRAPELPAGDDSASD